MVAGFLTICSGVVLLQLSKSAKDVPDAAVFSGDLDQIQTIAEQPQSETEPKADAIRGAAAIVRRLSSARQKMELEELRRMREEKLQETLEAVSEDGTAPQYQWDGLRRRRTGTFSSHRTPTPATTHLAPPTPHPPLGWSHFPTDEELAEASRPVSPALSSIMGTIRHRARSVLHPGHPEFRKPSSDASKVQSPMHPVQLTSIAIAGSNSTALGDYPPGTSASDDPSRSTRHVQFGQNISDDASDAPPTPPPHTTTRRQYSFQNMFRRHQAHAPPGSSDGPSTDHHSHATRPSSSRHGPRARGYSNTQARGATEEERLGLVKGDSNTPLAQQPSRMRYDDGGDDDDTDDEGGVYRDDKQEQYGHSITRAYSVAASHSPPRQAQPQPPPPPQPQPQPQPQQRIVQREEGLGLVGPAPGDEMEGYEARRRRFAERRRSGGGPGVGTASRSRSGDRAAREGPLPPPHGPSSSSSAAPGAKGGFI